MADLRLLGLALGNAQGGFDAAQRGLELALAQDQKMRQAKEQMMELALKDATYEPRQALAFLDLVRKTPASNEPRIAQSIALATDPFSSVTQISAPAPMEADPTLEKYRRQIQESRDQLSGQSVGLTPRGLGESGREVKEGYESGGAKLPLKLNKQQDAIERLRATPSRSPQSEGSIVMPLEGDIPVSVGGVSQMPATVIEGDPEAERALTHTLGRLSELDDPKYSQVFNSLMDPELRKKMIGAIALQGYVPGLAIQTDATAERVKALDSAQFMAAKSSTQMNQQASEAQAKMQLARLEARERELLDYARLAAEQGNKADKARIDMELERLKLALDAWRNGKPPATRGGSAKEDPNQASYRRRLEKAEQNIARFNSKLAGEFAGLDAATIKEIVKASPEDMADFNTLKALWLDGQNFTQVRNNFKNSLFSGISGITPEALFGSGTKSAGSKDVPAEGQERRNPKSGKIYVWRKGEWVPK